VLQDGHGHGQDHRHGNADIPPFSPRSGEARKGVLTVKGRQAPEGVAVGDTGLAGNLGDAGTQWA